MSNTGRDLVQIERLESRALSSAVALAPPAPPPLAASAPVSVAPKSATYKIADLLGISSAGASWTYDAQYSYTVDDSTESGSGTAKFTLPALPADTSITSFQVNIAGGKLKIETSSDETGTLVRVIGSKTGLGSVNIPIKLAAKLPSSLALGQSFKKSSPFSGSAKITLSALSGQTVSGAIQGTQSTSYRLPRTGIITVAAGRFKAVRCEIDFAMEGTMSASYRGKTYKAKISGELHQAMWAVPRLGIIKGDANVKLAASLNRLLSVSMSGNGARGAEDFQPAQKMTMDWGLEGGCHSAETSVTQARQGGA